jgi:protease IV
VSMGSAAASGGYYVAVAGKPIFANQSTITGSIGIFYGKVDVSQLLKTLGVGSDAFRSSPRADAESLFRPFTDDEREELGHKVKQFYDLFVGRVAEGRKMKPEAVDAIGRGKVWTGEQARDNGLVDRLGGLREALAEAQKQASIGGDYSLEELPVEDDSLLGFLLNLLGINVQAQSLTAIVPPALLDVARVLAPFTIYEADRPLARVDSFEETSFGARGRGTGSRDPGDFPADKDDK